MDGISIVTYKGKTIVKTDYSVVGNSKDKVIKLMAGVVEEFTKHPPKSVLGLTNVADLRFDMDILKIFKEAQGKTDQFEKKVAVYGVKGLLKAGYNFVVGLTKSTYKAFDNEQAAKEWLVSE